MRGVGGGCGGDGVPDAEGVTRWGAEGEAAASILFLALLGALGAITGGARPRKPVVRVVFWGALAMALTAGIRRVVGTSV
ncbi:hypothetical protein S2M10_29870 [Sphingomonas sp. S2M10]|nr:hypothetical protein [Sphingomonas sp. S2M10]